MAGVDIVTVAELMGHKDITMTKRYSHPTPEHKKRAIQHLNMGTIDSYLDSRQQLGSFAKTSDSNVTTLKQRVI